MIFSHTTHNSTDSTTPTPHSGIKRPPPPPCHAIRNDKTAVITEPRHITLASIPTKSDEGLQYDNILLLLQH